MLENGRVRGYRRFRLTFCLHLHFNTDEIFHRRENLISHTLQCKLFECNAECRLLDCNAAVIAQVFTNTSEGSIAQSSGLKVS